MKFKALFITFNIVLFLSFVTIFFLPFFILDGTFMRDFWSKNWFFSLIFLLILGIVNSVFLSNWKTLSFLENEDWPGLSAHLEKAVFEKKRYGKRQVSLLCDALLLLGDFDTLMRLQEVLRTQKPHLFALFGVKFAAASLLSKNYGGICTLALQLRDKKEADSDWLLFYEAFAQHLMKKLDVSSADFISLSENAGEPLVTALSGYMAGMVLVRNMPEKNTELSAASAEAKKRVREKYTQGKWKAYIDELKADMHVAVLGKLIDETGVWLFA